MSFIIQDKSTKTWIGTKQGLNLQTGDNSFQSFYQNQTFTAACNLENQIIFGTKNHGLLLYDLRQKAFVTHYFKSIPKSNITLLHFSQKGFLLIGTSDKGLFIYDTRKKQLVKHFLPEQYINKIYEDGKGKLWLNTQEFGIYQLDEDCQKIKKYILTSEKIRAHIDNERQFLFEDTKQNIWIGLQGGGLAFYDHLLDKFGILSK